MKILHSWLKDFIDIKHSPAELAEVLTALGIEVEGMEKTGAQFSGVAVAQILKIDRHPNADKLSLVELETAQGKKTVVCGAKNIAAGQKIPLATVGAVLPGGTLKKSKIRGIESEGMICASDELGLPGGSHEGILVLDAGLAIGADVSKLFGEPDCVFDLKAPNRPDLLSHFGVARELAAYLGIELKKPRFSLPAPSGEALPVSIDAPECGRYIGRVLRNVSAAQSPDWMKRRLEAIGSKPRNILVDATNYVLHELGYPLHAFDLTKITAGRISVRRAAAGEKFTALDNRVFELDETCLLITDGAKPLALGGVIGGLESGIYDTTKDIFLEAAWFNPPTINRTARKFAARTDAAQRFEAGADIEAAEFASQRAAALILESCPGAAVSNPADVYPGKYSAQTIEFTPAQINAVLGTELPDAKIADALKRIQPELDTAGPVWKFKTLSHRHDITNRWDLAEETARMCGFDKIKDTPRPVMVSVAEPPAPAALADRWRDALAGLGFFEAWNYDFMSAAELGQYGFEVETAAELLNPLSEDWRYLRRTLLCGLVKTLAYNENHGAQSASLFEIGKVYRAAGGGRVAEDLVCSGLVCGKFPADIFWRGSDMKAYDFYHLKGVIAKITGGMAGVRFVPAEKTPAHLHPKLALAVLAGDKPAGFIGKLHPSVVKAAGIRNNDCWAFELNMDMLSRNVRPALFHVKAVSQFPSSWRDMSVLVPSDTQAQPLLEAARKAGGEFVSGVAMTDLYEGKGMPEGKKSVTMRLVFTPRERTLTDAEVDAAFKTVLDRLAEKFSAALRS
jgi:phenylalanyl-tRNA synthetase beta chain